MSEFLKNVKDYLINAPQVVASILKCSPFVRQCGIIEIYQ